MKAIAEIRDRGAIIRQRWEREFVDMDEARTWVCLVGLATRAQAFVRIMEGNKATEAYEFDGDGHMSITRNY